MQILVIIKIKSITYIFPNCYKNTVAWGILWICVLRKPLLQRLGTLYAIGYIHVGTLPVSKQVVLSFIIGLYI